MALTSSETDENLTLSFIDLHLGHFEAVLSTWEMPLGIGMLKVQFG